MREICFVDKCAVNVTLNTYGGQDSEGKTRKWLREILCNLKYNLDSSATLKKLK